MNTNVYSDHAMVAVDIKCKVIKNVEANNNITECAPYKKPKWKEEYKEEYLNLLNSEEVENKLISLIVSTRPGQ